jgi:hypothetical protein
VELKATVTSSAPAGHHDQNARVVVLEGAGRFQGEAFELGMRGGSLLALRGQEEPYPLEAKIRVGETEATLAGTVRGPLPASDLRLNLNITGPNAALLAPILNVPLPRIRPYAPPAISFAKGLSGGSTSSATWWGVAISPVRSRSTLRRLCPSSIWGCRRIATA